MMPSTCCRWKTLWPTSLNTANVTEERWHDENGVPTQGLGSWPVGADVAGRADAEHRQRGVACQPLEGQRQRGTMPPCRRPRVGTGVAYHRCQQEPRRPEGTVPPLRSDG